MFLPKSVYKYLPKSIPLVPHVKNLPESIPSATWSVGSIHQIGLLIGTPVVTALSASSMILGAYSSWRAMYFLDRATTLDFKSVLGSVGISRIFYKMFNTYGWRIKKYQKMWILPLKIKGRRDYRMTPKWTISRLSWRDSNVTNGL